MKVWITKYALTRGIYECEVELCDAGLGKMVRDLRPGAYSIYYHKPNWHETEMEAIAHAESMRNNKIKLLTLQLSRLKTLTFD